MPPRITSTDLLESFPLLGADVVPLVAGERARSAGWEAIELTVAPGGATPLHRLHVQKLFYVVDGTLTLRVADTERRTGRGGTAWVPAGVEHAYRNDTDRSARVLVITTGSGHVPFLAGMSRLFAAGEPDPQALGRHLEEYGVEIVAS